MIAGKFTGSVDVSRRTSTCFHAQPRIVFCSNGRQGHAKYLPVENLDYRSGPMKELSQNTHCL